MASPCRHGEIATSQAQDSSFPRSPDVCMHGLDKPGLAVVAGLLHANSLPDLALAAAGLDHAGGLAEAREAEGDVLTHEGVCVVPTHGLGFGVWCLIEMCRSEKWFGRPGGLVKGG